MASAPGPAGYFSILSVPDFRVGPVVNYAAFATQAGSDNLFEFGWSYRIAGDPENSAFNDGPGGGQVVTTPSTYAPGPPELNLNLSPMRVAWQNTDGRGFDADWTVGFTELGHDRAQVDHSFTVHNPATTPLVMELFLYADIDVGSAFGNEDARAAPRGRFVVTDPATRSFVGLTAQPAPDHWEVGAWGGGLDTRLRSGGAYDLADTGMPFVGDDWTGAMQWSLQIPAGQSVTIHCELGRNSCGAPLGVSASVQRYGTAVGGLAGPPTLFSHGLPVLGGAFDLVIGNGAPGGSAFLMIGEVRTSIPFCGIEILVTPWTTVSIPMNGAGEGALPIYTPCDPQFAGFDIFAQAFVIDLTSPSACFAVAHSDGIWLTLGD